MNPRSLSLCQGDPGPSVPVLPAPSYPVPLNDFCAPTPDSAGQLQAPDRPKGGHKTREASGRHPQALPPSQGRGTAGEESLATLTALRLTPQGQLAFDGSKKTSHQMGSQDCSRTKKGVKTEGWVGGGRDYSLWVRSLVHPSCPIITAVQQRGPMSQQELS